MNLNSKAPLWQLGFRSFFLGGALFSAVSVGLWLAFLFGGLPYSGYLNPVTWHSHEMIFGFSSAIIAGFVLTAVQNWTGKRGIHGLRLQFIFLFWILGRFLLMVPAQFKSFAAVVDLAFYPLLACFLIPYLRDPGLKIERVFLAYFALFFTGNLLVHLESLGFVSGFSRKGIFLGLHTVILVIVFMGGRVIPFFTESTVAKSQPKTWRLIEVFSHLITWVFVGVQFFDDASLVGAFVAFFAASIHVIRLYGWYVRRIRRVPIIWILHLAYLWVVIGFVLSGFSSLGLINSSLAVHAFTVGAVGTIIYGMITRVSLGHTGRPLRPSIPVVLGYYFMVAAAILRVLIPMLNSSFHDAAVIGSGLFWIFAFIIFLVVYGPILTAARIDGREG